MKTDKSLSDSSNEEGDRPFDEFQDQKLSKLPGRRTYRDDTLLSNVKFSPKRSHKRKEKRSENIRHSVSFSDKGVFVSDVDEKSEKDKKVDESIFVKEDDAKLYTTQPNPRKSNPI